LNTIISLQITKKKQFLPKIPNIQNKPSDQPAVPVNPVDP
jgi:hypothetical protein